MELSLQIVNAVAIVIILFKMIRYFDYFFFYNQRKNIFLICWTPSDTFHTIFEIMFKVVIETSTIFERSNILTFIILNLAYESCIWELIGSHNLSSCLIKVVCYLHQCSGFLRKHENTVKKQQQLKEFFKKKNTDKAVTKN